MLMPALGSRSAAPHSTVAAAVLAAAICGLPLLVGLPLLGGCGGGGGVHQSPQTVYPEQQYLVAVGTSPLSMQDAENRARHAVAAQIRSSLESRIDTRIESQITGGVEDLRSSTRQDLQQEVGFSRAELIRIDLDSRRERDGRYEVVAYLPRREAAQALRRDYDAAAAALQRQAGALDAVPRGDLPGFAAAYAVARRSWADLSRCSRELWAITGQAPAGFGQEQARWHRVEERRLAVLDGVRVAFALREPRPAGDRLDAAFLEQQFRDALTGMGLTLRGRDCDGGDYLVELQPRLHYQGVIGVVCRLDFAGRLVECATGDAWNLHLEDERFTGEGSNTYAARKGAEAAATAEVLAPLLAEALEESLPVR
jgi:hypothetical protein